MAESYSQKAFEDRLSIFQKQTTEQLAENSALQRKMKKLRQADFQQQVQPLYAQAQFVGGEILSKQGPRTGTLRKGYNPGEMVQPAKTAVTGTTGSMSVSPAQQWTTSGNRNISSASSTQNKLIKGKVEKKTRLSQLREKFHAQTPPGVVPFAQAKEK